MIDSARSGPAPTAELHAAEPRAADVRLHPGFCSIDSAGRGLSPEQTSTLPEASVDGVRPLRNHRGCTGRAGSGVKAALMEGQLQALDGGHWTVKAWVARCQIASVSLGFGIDISIDNRFDIIDLPCKLPALDRKQSTSIEVTMFNALEDTCR